MVSLFAGLNLAVLERISKTISLLLQFERLQQFSDFRFYTSIDTPTVQY